MLIKTIKKDLFHVVRWIFRITWMPRGGWRILALTDAPVFCHTQIKYSCRYLFCFFLQRNSWTLPCCTNIIHWPVLFLRTALTFPTYWISKKSHQLVLNCTVTTAESSMIYVFCLYKQITLLVPRTNINNQKKVKDVNHFNLT